MSKNKKLKEIENLVDIFVAHRVVVSVGSLRDLAEQILRNYTPIIKDTHSAGFYRQLFREMPDDKTFTAKELADMFEIHAPFDPKGLLKKAIKEHFATDGITELHKKRLIPRGDGWNFIVGMIVIIYVVCSVVIYLGAK